MESKESLESIKSRTNLKRNFVQRSLRNFIDGNILRQINACIEQAYELGLPVKDIENSLTDLEYNEPELSFDTIAEQMYENRIKIDQKFYDLILEICKILKIDSQKYSYLKELLD